jgi:pimeloyl-ACP methyl ester carboxylesterase
MASLTSSWHSSLTSSEERKLGSRREGDRPVLVCHPLGPGFSPRYLGDMAGLGALFTLVMVDPRSTAESDRPARPRDGEMERRSGGPWDADAGEELAAEETGSFASDAELTELVLRQLPLFFANYGPREMAYVDALRAEVVHADALRLWDSEIQGTFDLRSSLASISAATLVITCRDDFITGRTVCRGGSGGNR